MAKITKDMLIGEILQLHPNMAAVLMSSGMHCVGCPSSQMESLEEAVAVHDLPIDLVVARLNAFLQSFEEQDRR